MEVGYFVSEVNIIGELKRNKELLRRLVRLAVVVYFTSRSPVALSLVTLIPSLASHVHCSALCNSSLR